CFISYMCSFHCLTETPSCCLTLSASNEVLCGTFTTPPEPSAKLIARVLLHTTRILVNCAVVARVPSQAVASKRYPLLTSPPFRVIDCPVRANAHILRPPFR